MTPSQLGVASSRSEGLPTGPPECQWRPRTAIAACRPQDLLPKRHPVDYFLTFSLVYFSALFFCTSSKISLHACSQAIFQFLFMLTASRAPAAPRSRPAGGGGAAAAQLDELNAQVLEKNLTIEGLEKERDFYFGKLRDIEIIVQEFENVEGVAEFGQKVLGVLYATEVNNYLHII